MVIRVYKCKCCGVEITVRETMSEKGNHKCGLCNLEMKSVPQITYTTYNKKGKLDK